LSTCAVALEASTPLRWAGAQRAPRASARPFVERPSRDIAPLQLPAALLGGRQISWQARASPSLTHLAIATCGGWTRRAHSVPNPFLLPKHITRTHQGGVVPGTRLRDAREGHGPRDHFRLVRMSVVFGDGPLRRAFSYAPASLGPERWTSWATFLFRALSVAMSPRDFVGTSFDSLYSQRLPAGLGRGDGALRGSCHSTRQDTHVRKLRR